MIQRATERRRSGILLASAMIWLVVVTLCSLRVIAEPAHNHAATEAGHSHDSAHHKEGQRDDSCGCESFNSFPGDMVTLAKAPAPTDPLLLYTVLPDGVAYESAATTVTAQNTGPPGRIAVNKLILQRCRLSHAPPFVV